MDSKKLDSWLASFLGCLEDFCEDLEDWLMSCRYSPCYDPDHSSDEAAFDEGRSPAWTIEEQDAIDDLLIYLEKRLPILKDDCPKDLKEHLNVTVNRDRLWALNLLSSSDRVQPRRKGASNLLTISRLMLVKGKGISNPDLCIPIIRLLESLDFGIQGSAALSVSTFADRANSDPVRSANLRHLREGGVIAALLPLLASRSISVQGRATGAITALTSVPDEKLVEVDSEMAVVQNHLLTLGLVPSLLPLLRPPYIEDAILTNNVVGSLLNLSHFPNGRSSIVLSGGVPVLVNSLRYLVDEALPHVNLHSSSDSRRYSSGSEGKTKRKRDRTSADGSEESELHRNCRKRLTNVIEDLSLFYALATLTNLCESPVYRTMIVGVGSFDVVGHLVDIVDSLSATSDEAVSQACVLLRNLAIESDHRLLFVKRGVVTAMESLVKALLQRCDKEQRRQRGMSDSQGSDLFEEGELANVEKILTAALQFLENLSLHSFSRKAIMSEERKLTELLFKIVGFERFSEVTRRNVVRVLASVCAVEEVEANEQNQSKLSPAVRSKFLADIQASALDLMTDTTLESEVIVLDLLALLLKFLSTFSSEEKIRILSENDNQAALRAKMEVKLAEFGGDGGDGEPGTAFVKDYTHFLNETAVSVKVS